MTRLEYTFPIRHQNSFKLLTEGDHCFQAMLDAVESARHFILLEQYLVESGKITGQFVSHLISAANRGVTIYLLLDDFGSRGLNSADRNQLLNSGIDLVFYNPLRFRHSFRNLFRNHRKLMVVDGLLAYVGGTGLTDEFSQQHSGKKSWRDVMLEVRGEVVEDWCATFLYTWKECTGKVLLLPRAEKHANNQGQSGRVLLSAPFKRLEISRALIREIRKARHRIWITSPYFVPSRKIRRILGQAAHRGVDVRLLLPGTGSDHPWISYAARGFYARLLESGVRIFEYLPRFTHAKIEVCDDWVSIGSSNLDRWNQSWNLDANQTVRGNNFAHQVVVLFEKDFEDSREYSLESWQKRPLRVRLGEVLSRTMVFWLQKLIKRYRK